MARKKLTLVPNAEREQRLREITGLIAENTQIAYLRWGKLIKEKRSEYKIPRKLLARMAGISDGTLKNLENGSQKVACSWDTINRIMMILNTPTLANNELLYSSAIKQRFWLADYDYQLQLQLASRSLYQERPRLDYYHLRSTDESIDAYMVANRSMSYSIHHASSFRAFNCISMSISHSLMLHKVEIISLTVGHGWAEYLLINHLLQIDEQLVIYLYIVCENEYLLSIGEREIIQHVPRQFRYRLRVTSIVGSHMSFARSVYGAFPSPWQRIYFLSGTLMNIDNGEELLKQLCRKMFPGDLLCFDINIASKISRVFEDDARLCDGKLPRDFIAAIEQSVYAAIDALEGMGNSIEAIEWSYGIRDQYGVCSTSLQAYSIHMNALVYDKKIAPRMISCMRIHRHNVGFLVRFLAGFRMRLIGDAQWGKENGIDYPGMTLLFTRY